MVNSVVTASGQVRNGRIKVIVWVSMINTGITKRRINNRKDIWQLR